MGLERVDVSKIDLLKIGTGSSGCQRKWLKDNRYIKLSILGYEHVAECLTYWLLCNSNIDKKFIVPYYPCDIYQDGIYLGQGCYSYSFLGDGIELSVANILDKYLASYSSSYDDVIQLVYNCINYNCENDINTILAVDAITRNDDRHFRNIVFVIDKDNTVLSVPIFDNGGGCMSDLVSYPLNVPIDKLWSSVYAKPFSVTFGRDIRNFNPIKINVSKFLMYYDKSKCNVICKRAYDVIIKGLKETENKIWIRL